MPFIIHLGKRPPVNKRSAHRLPAELLATHFGETDLSELAVTTRNFVHRVRPDLQLALEELLAPPVEIVHFSGVRREYQHMGGLDFGSLVGQNSHPATISAPEYDQVDIGEDKPVNCLKAGFWLLREADEPYALLVSPCMTFTEGPVITVNFSLASRNTPQGMAISDRFFQQLEESVARSKSFRGKVLSLEARQHYTGQSSGITVHQLAPVSREDLILPDATVQLLERNVLGFCRRRAELARRGQSARKGLLFYGPPGTGKTFTIRYLAGVLPDHTTLLITAEQVGLLPEYMTLARLLQPSIVVIEDADLIARDRSTMENTCEEVMLNKLLNEMDGLREDAQILFILTTNRPEMLEAALAARPGRIDQAIEFPVPDAANRAKLVRVYARGMPVPDDVMNTVVSRTPGVSASFIKELVRRSIQFWMERDSDEPQIGVADVDAALEEILFQGGSLNVTLLGGVGAK